MADHRSGMAREAAAGDLISAAGIGTVEIMRRISTSRPYVWRWQERFAARANSA